MTTFRHRCRVCTYDGLMEEPWIDDVPSRETCPGCGTQFGRDDVPRRWRRKRRRNVYRWQLGLDSRWAELYRQWADRGQPWTSAVVRPPASWPPGVTAWVEHVVEETHDDYVGMTSMAGLLDTAERPRDLMGCAERVAATLDALRLDDRVVVVEGHDMTTPVEPGIGARYLEWFREKGEVFDGELAWVLSRATWEKENGPQ